MLIKPYRFKNPKAHDFPLFSCPRMASEKCKSRAKVLITLARARITMRATVRRNAFSFVIRMVLILAGLHIPANCSRAQHEVFDKSVLQKWKDYETFSQNLQGVVKWTGTIPGKKAQIYVFRYKQNRESALAIYPHDSDTETCHLVNPRYTARIRRSTSDLNNATLIEYEPRSSSEFDSHHHSFDAAFLETSPHFSYSLARLTQLVLYPSFKVTKVTTENHNGQKLIRVDHTYNDIFHGSKVGRQEQIRGSLYFDPSQCWCVRRYKKSSEVRFNEKRIVDIDSEVEFETIDHPSGFPIIKTQTLHRITFVYQTNEKKKLTSRGEYDLEVKQGPPNSEFTLTAFGLPEPGSEPVKKSIPRYVWILVAAAVCAVVALGFRYLARRAHPKPSA